MKARDAKQALLNYFPNLAYAVPETGEDIAWSPDVSFVCPSSSDGYPSAGVVCVGGKIVELR